MTDNWSEITSYFEKITKDQTFKHSRIHVRRLKNTDSIFEMNYDVQRKSGDDNPKNIIDAQYIVITDITKFFDSIYSHSVPWALMGKDAAKIKRRFSCYENNIDKRLMNMRCGETHGILTGPVSSNIISEILLCNVDSILSKKGYRFVRYIDDYRCYVNSADEGNKFIDDLRRALSLFDLSINNSKTQIISITRYNNDSFPDDIASIANVLSYQEYSKCETYPEGVVSYLQLNSFFNLLFGVFNKYGEDGRVLLYAFKVLKRKNLSLKASEFYVNKVMNLAIKYPYLLSTIDNEVFSKFGVTNNISLFCKTLYESGCKESNYEKMIYSLYFAIKSNVDFLENKDSLFNNAKNYNDCIFKLIAYKYSETFSIGVYFEKYKELARDLYKDDYEREKNWIFVYELLDETELTNEWAILKNNKVTFINDKKLKPHIHFRTMFYPK